MKYLLSDKQIKNILNQGLEYGVNEGWCWDEFTKDILKKYSKYKIKPFNIIFNPVCNSEYQIKSLGDKIVKNKVKSLFRTS